MAGVTRYVIARFPAYELAIERLVRSSEHFREMCEEHAAGTEALERWQQGAPPQADIAELRDSLTGLEEEILEALQQEVKPGKR